jgi:hypothetical protein
MPEERHAVKDFLHVHVILFGPPPVTRLSRARLSPVVTTTMIGHRGKVSVFVSRPQGVKPMRW